MTDPNWLPKVERRVTRWAAAAERGAGRSWLVAVSGGGDSVGLLWALHGLTQRLGLTLSVAHLNHGARGEASEADAAFVEALARSLGLPIDLGRWRSARPGHFEADARRARYAWLAEVARARGAGVIAVGHTRDDQAETVLHRVVRGTGVRGLAGIPEARKLGGGLILVRPLLSVSRQEVRAYLAGLNLSYRDDPSNADTARTRARLRHDLLPKLADEYNPKVVEALVRLSQLAGAADRACRERVGAMARSATQSVAPGRVCLDRDTLLTFPPFFLAEVIRLAWRRSGWPEAGMSAARWRRLARLVRRQGEGRFDVGGGVVAETGAGRFVLSRLVMPEVRPAASDSGPLPLEIPGSVPWSGGRVVVTVDPDAPCDETMDLDRVVPPLVVRAPAPGDRFGPLGLGGRSQPLNDFFRGRGVSPDRRARTPLVCDQSGIVWVVGHRIADRVRLDDSTTRRAGLRWDAGADEGVGGDEPRSCG